MTAFELCRQQSTLELAPVLRVVKYLGLDSSSLDARDVAQIEVLHPYFLHDPELIVGIHAIAERAGLASERVESLLLERRREIPFLGTPGRPTVPGVAIEMLRRAHAGEETLTGANGNGRSADASTAVAPELQARIGRLELELEAALEQVRGLSQTLTRISDNVIGPARTNGDEPARRHRRSGGGRPDTIVEACRTVLSEATHPMKVADITERVISRGVEIRAKNPNVTVSSILSSYEVFERVRRGYYTLAGVVPD